MASFINITSKDEVSSLLASTAGISLLHFYTPWTERSTTMTPDLAFLISQYTATSNESPASFFKINSKKVVGIASEYGISKAPSVVWLRDGQLLETIQGNDFSAVRSSFQRHCGFDASSITIPIKEPEPLDDATKEAVFAQLAQLVKSTPFMLFMKGTPKSPSCRFSRRMVDFLKEQELDYGSFNILEDQHVRNGLKEFGDWPTFPQLWANGELVGGLDVVREEVAANPQFLKQLVSV